MEPPQSRPARATQQMRNESDANRVVDVMPGRRPPRRDPASPRVQLGAASDDEKGMRARLAGRAVAGVLTGSLHGCGSSSSTKDGAVDAVKTPADAAGAADSPGYDRPSAGDVAVDAPSGVDRRADQVAGG